MQLLDCELGLLFCQCKQQMSIFKTTKRQNIHSYNQSDGFVNSLTFKLKYPNTYLNLLIMVGHKSNCKKGWESILRHLEDLVIVFLMAILSIIMFNTMPLKDHNVQFLEIIDFFFSQYAGIVELTNSQSFFCVWLVRPHKRTHKHWLFYSCEGHFQRKIKN